MTARCKLPSQSHAPLHFRNDGVRMRDQWISSLSNKPAFASSAFHENRWPGPELYFLVCRSCFLHGVAQPC
eukprot:490543-Amphidinium_carterae.1